jgi:hypothetical protein
LLILELPKGVLDWGRLGECQQDAKDGLYAQAFASYVQWVARHYEQIHARLKEETEELRREACRSANHKRTPDIVAKLAIGMRHFLSFAREMGAITAEEERQLWQRCWQALGAAGTSQASHLAAADAASRFMELICAVLSSGRAHVAGPENREPENPEAWGWRNSQSQYGEWKPQGHQIGWLDGEDLYLESEAAYAEAQSLAREGNEPLPVGKTTLHKRLHERGILASTGPTRGTLTVRKTLAGRRREVLHIHSQSVLSLLETDQSDQTDQDGTEEPSLDDGSHLPGQFPLLSVSETDHENCPQEPWEDGEETRMVSLGSLVSSSEQETQDGAAAVAAPVLAIPETPLKPCYICGGTRFWRDRYDTDHCATCHAPPDNSHVAECVEAVARVRAEAE